MITENISTLKIQKLAKKQFEDALAANILDSTSIYLTPTEKKDYALKSDLGQKADIVDGKVPVEQVPVATATTLGGIKVGANLSISEDGTLSAINSGSGSGTEPGPVSGVIRYDESQELSEEEKLVARTNIDAVAANDVYNKDTVYTKEEVNTTLSTNYYPKSEVYTKNEVNNTLSTNYYTKSETYTKDEVYPKTDVYTKNEVYAKDEVYSKTDVYNKSEVYSKNEVDAEFVSYYTAEEVNTELNKKADLVNGKVPTSQLPDSISSFQQTQADWFQTNSSQPDFIKNKPTNISTFTNDANYQTAQQMSTALAGKSDTGHVHAPSDLTSVIGVELGGTGYSSIVDTVYTQARYRASSLHSTATTPSTNGAIAWQYE